MEFGPSGNVFRAILSKSATSVRPKRFFGVFWTFLSLFLTFFSNNDLCFEHFTLFLTFFSNYGLCFEHFSLFLTFFQQLWFMFSLLCAACVQCLVGKSICNHYCGRNRMQPFDSNFFGHMFWQWYFSCFRSLMICIYVSIYYILYMY